MRVFKVKTFARFSRKEDLPDASLLEAVNAAERGLIDADLGGGLIKQRVARSGGGKRGGFRTVIWDRPNCGESDISFAGETESAMNADALAGLLAKLDFGPTMLVGGSAGSAGCVPPSSVPTTASFPRAVWWSAWPRPHQAAQRSCWRRSRGSWPERSQWQPVSMSP